MCSTWKTLFSPHRQVQGCAGEFGNPVQILAKPRQQLTRVLSVDGDAADAEARLAVAVAHDGGHGLKPSIKIAVIQRSHSMGVHVFYLRVAVSGTGGTDLEWVPAKGTRTVYVITGDCAREGIYNIVLVELKEGPRMMFRIKGVETIAIGTRVRHRDGDDGASLTCRDCRCRAATRGQ